jgi:hypothetical protein
MRTGLAEASSATTIYVDVAALVLIHQVNKLYVQDEHGHDPLVVVAELAFAMCPTAMCPTRCDVRKRSAM